MSGALLVPGARCASKARVNSPGDCDWIRSLFGSQGFVENVVYLYLVPVVLSRLLSCHQTSASDVYFVQPLLASIGASDAAVLIIPGTCCAIDARALEMTALQLILRDSLNSHQFCLKHQYTPRGYRPYSLVTITHLRRNRQLPFLTNAHVYQSLVPPVPSH